MKILSHLKKGAVRSLKAWKGVLVIWFLIFILISLVVLPVRSGFKSMIGSSMITELLTESINADVITDLLQGVRSLMPVLKSGFLLIILMGFFMNAFLTGGIFSILGNKNNNHSISHFFAGGASNFWSVLVINLMVTLIFIVTVSILGGIPALIVTGSGTPEPGSMGKVIRISMIIMALLLPVILLVADYARAWQVVHDSKKPFKAIGFGFSRSFKTFLVSYPVMLILVLIQSGFGALVMSNLLTSKPATGGGVFLLFLSSQILFFLRLMLRVWRYGSVTSLMEDTATKLPEPANIKSVSPDQSVLDAEPL